MLKRVVFGVAARLEYHEFCFDEVVGEMTSGVDRWHSVLSFCELIRRFSSPFFFFLFLLYELRSTV